MGFLGLLEGFLWGERNGVLGFLKRGGNVEDFDFGDIVV